MATEKLVVQLESDTAKLRADLDKVDDKLNKVDGSTKKADSSFSSMASSSINLAKGVAGAAAAFGALVTSLSAAAISSANYAREIKLAAQLSGVAVKEIQLISAATATVGIGMEQLGDISKDTLEKIGDYLNTGGGGFMDYVDAMKLTERQAIETANEFKNMSGPAVLQEMVKRMEAANISSVQMSHALEGMASDTTKLIPLLTDGAKAMNALKDASLNVTVPLSDEDIERFNELKISADNAAASLYSLGNTTLLSLSNWFIKTADTAAHFYGTLNAGSVAQKSSRLADIKDELDTLRQSAEDANSWTGRLYNTLTFNTYQEQFANEKINALLEERKKLQSEIAESSGLILPTLQDSEQNTAEDPLITPMVTENKAKDDLTALQDRFKSEEELLTAKYEKEMELARNNNELMAQLENEYLFNKMTLREEADLAEQEAERDRYFEHFESLGQEKFDAEIAEQQRLLEAKLINEEDYLKAVNKTAEKYGKIDKKESKKTNEDKEDDVWGYADSAMDAAGAIFGNNKEVSSTLAFINTAEGVTAALAKYDYVGAAVIAATGAAQIASINSATPGSAGSISTPSSPSAPSENNNRFSSSVEVNESVTGGGSTSNNVNFTADDADGIGGAIANWLNNKLSDGSVKLGG